MKEMKNAVRILHSESCIIREVHASEVFYTLTNKNLPVAFVSDGVSVLCCVKFSCKSRSKSMKFPHHFLPFFVSLYCAAGKIS